MSIEKVNVTSVPNVRLCEIFECNICFHEATEAVVTCCGHLFCWPCLYMWLYVHSLQQSCPVCIGLINDGDITPIYGPTNLTKPLWIDGVSKNDEGERLIPPRPQARRIQCNSRQLSDHEEIESRNERRLNANSNFQPMEGQTQQINHTEQSTLEVASTIPLLDQTNLEEIIVIEPNEQNLEDINLEVHLENANDSNENNECNILVHLDQRQVNGINSLPRFFENDETTLENLDIVFNIQHSTT